MLMISSLLVHFGGDRQEKYASLPKSPVKSGGSSLWFRGFKGGSPLKSIGIYAPMNPCPCGNYRSRAKQCRCLQPDIKRYLSRISGLLPDRIDVHTEVESIPQEMPAQAPEGEAAAKIGARVEPSPRHSAPAL